MAWSRRSASGSLVLSVKGHDIFHEWESQTVYIILEGSTSALSAEGKIVKICSIFYMQALIGLMLIYMGFAIAQQISNGH
jgi:hypothetical protein